MKLCECGEVLEYRECWKCGGEGVDGHECGEDSCCCRNPEPNRTCNTCDGRGAWYVCPACYPSED